MSTTALVMQPSLSPVSRRTRAYFAPVQRLSATPTSFDASTVAAFDPDAPPAPWIELGWIRDFRRTSETKLQTIRGGAPAAVLAQGRQSIGATLTMTFERWSKLTMALSCGGEQLNVLAANAAPVPVNAAASTATFLALPNGPGGITAGSMIAVDLDYTGQTGYVGAGSAGAYLASPAGSDMNWIRRVTLNVARVTQVTSTGLVLAEALMAGVPSQGMQAVPIVALQDREGGSFFQEWSGLFVMNGEQGDALFFYYPRLQTASGTAEATSPLPAPMSEMLLAGSFLALPVTDATDGAQVCCYRTYLPCSNAQMR